MILQVTNVFQSYGKKTILNDVSVRIGPGICGLLGPNGAGKTTLLRTMATILPPASGTVTVNGTVAGTSSLARAARRHIGYLPQAFGADPNMSVEDFVRYAAWLRQTPKATRQEDVTRALYAVDLTSARRSRMKTLSGGMRQRAGIAWAIVGQPSVILLDEPTIGLDPQQRLQFRRVLSEMRQSAIVLSTHLIDDIDAICDQVVVVHEGRIRFEGTTSQMADLSTGVEPGNSVLEKAYMSLLPAQLQQS